MSKLFCIQRLPTMMIRRPASTLVARPSLLRRGAPLLTASRQYHAKVLDHYNNPRNVGSMNKNDTDVRTGLVGAPACGDVMKLQIRVDDNGIINDVKFKTFDAAAPSRPRHMSRSSCAACL